MSDGRIRKEKHCLQLERSAYHYGKDLEINKKKKKKTFPVTRKFIPSEIADYSFTRSDRKVLGPIYLGSII